MKNKRYPECKIDLALCNQCQIYFAFYEKELSLKSPARASVLAAASVAGGSLLQNA